MIEKAIYFTTEQLKEIIKGKAGVRTIQVSILSQRGITIQIKVMRSD